MKSKKVSPPRYFLSAKRNRLRIRAKVHSSSPPMYFLHSDWPWRQWGEMFNFYDIYFGFGLPLIYHGLPNWCSQLAITKMYRIFIFLSFIVSHSTARCSKFSFFLRFLFCLISTARCCIRYVCWPWNLSGVFDVMHSLDPPLLLTF